MTQQLRRLERTLKRQNGSMTIQREECLWNAVCNIRILWGIQNIPVNIEIQSKKEYAGKEYKTKIEMHIDTIKRCMQKKLNFSMVVGDTWYFTKALVSFLNKNNPDWLFARGHEY